MKKFFQRENGQSMAEYALLLALVAIVVIAGVSLFGTKIKDKFNGAATRIESAGT